MAGLSNAFATLATAAVLATGTANATDNHKFSDVVAAGWPQVEAVVANTAHSVHILARDTQPTLLAQASQETDGKTYTAEVVQVDGTKKTVQYFRDKEWAIIPPSVTDGKLVDGSNAPDHPLRAKSAQVKILAKYDRWSLLALAMVWSQDIITDARKDINVIMRLMEQWKQVSLEQIQKSLFGIYILKLSWSDITERMKTMELITVNQLRINQSELSKMKQEAESRAINVWKSTTGSMIAR